MFQSTGYCAFLASIWLGIGLPQGIATAQLTTRQPITSTPFDLPDGSLIVIDDAGAERPFTPADFARLPRRSVKVSSHGTDAEFQGVLLVDLLKEAGVKFGSELRGRRTPTVAILEATDGYRVVISLLEIDPATNDREAIVADRRDGEPLDSHLGPFRLVIPGDKREVRWIRNLRTIRVMNLIDVPIRKVAETGADAKR